MAYVNSPAVNGSPLAINWHLYLTECADGSLYAGITADVERRFREHLSGKGARYLPYSPSLANITAVRL